MTRVRSVMKSRSRSRCAEATALCELFGLSSSAPTSISPLLSRLAAHGGLTDLAARIHRAGGTGASVRLEGKASQEIVRYAETHDASLIVVGKHGRGRLADKLIGSTAAHLCEVAGRPVLMVP